MSLRLALALAAVLLASPAMADLRACKVHVHKGAIAYIQAGDIGPMIPATTGGRRVTIDKADEGVDHLDTLTPDGPWVWRAKSYVFRLRDVTLYGDCTHMRVNDLC